MIAWTWAQDHVVAGESRHFDPKSGNYLAGARRPERKNGPPVHPRSGRFVAFCAGSRFRPAISRGGSSVDGAETTSSAIDLAKGGGGGNGVMNNSGIQSVQPSERHGRRRVLEYRPRFEVLQKPPHGASLTKKFPHSHEHDLLPALVYNEHCEAVIEHPFKNSLNQGLF